MKIKTICLILLIITVSCNNSDKKDLDFEFNDNLTYNDLFNLSLYDKLSNDDSYKQYIDDLWEYNIEINKNIFESNKLIGSEVNIEIDTKGNEPVKQGKKMLGIIKYAGNGFVNSVKVGHDAYKLIKLEERAKILHESFSSKKGQIANNFERQLNKLIEFSCNFPKNQNVKEKSHYKNYYSISEILSEDKDAMEYLEPLLDKVDKFFIENVEIKTIILLNQVIYSRDYNLQITEFSNKVLTSKGDLSININSRVLSSYFNSMNEIVKIINNQKFSIPVEDWSDEKQKNFNFIISDIKIKLENEVKSLKYSEFKTI